MTRTISAGLLTHLQGETTTLATCWKITRTDSVVLGFTNHDEDIVSDGVTYIAATGFIPSDVALKDDFSVSNLEVTGVLDNSYITEADLMNGLYDYAQVEVFLINYENTAIGTVFLNGGYLGEVSVSKGQFMGEIRGLSQHLSQRIGEVYSPTCRANLGDSRCTKDLTAFTFNDSIDTVTTNQIFYAGSLNQTPGYFNYGKVTWTSGNNSGLSMEIKEFLTGVITLVLPMPNNLQVGDTFTIVAGCDKQFSTCKDKYNNVLNFRGEPHVPGQDKVLETAGTFNDE